ncbi:hypothetical protein Tco_0355496 [Tanacetum coccineum]
MLRRTDQGNEQSKLPIPYLDEEIKFVCIFLASTPQQLNPNQDTGVDDIFRQNTEATSFIDTNINRPPTPHPIIIQPQQQPIMTPATTTSSLLQNLPNFASLFGFDHRLKALEDNFSELKQTNQYAEALSSIPSTVDQYLAHKMQEAVDVAVQLKYDKIEKEVRARRSKTALRRKLVERMKLTRIMLDTYGDTVTIKRPRDGADDDERTLRWNRPGEYVPVSCRRHETANLWLSSLAQQDPRESFDELTDSTFDFSAFVLNRLNVQTLTPELLAGLTFELMKGTCRSLTELEYFCERESARDVYSKRRIIAVTKVEIVEWHDYKHLDWIHTKGKMINSQVQRRRLTQTRVVIQRRWKIFNCGLKVNQKKLNLTKPELSDVLLDDVRLFLNDPPQGTRMGTCQRPFEPTRQRQNARAMIQRLEQELKTKEDMSDFGRDLSVDDLTVNPPIRRLCKNGDGVA